MEVSKKAIEADRRTLIQNAKLSIRDIYDAVTELVTNADDRYQILGCSGTVEIEVERRRSGNPSILRVRDYADGMTADVMENKLSRLGGRVSGFESGFSVRGTNSRGAKDVAALGNVTFQSIAEDGQYHKCEITSFMEFKRYPSTPVTKKVRKEIGIPKGTGTLVTIEVESRHRIQQHDNLCKGIGHLVSLRDILSDPKREIVLRDTTQDREDALQPPEISGKERVNESLKIPGYPDAKAKLTIYRARKRFGRGKERFRLNGVVIKSRHAIHEATLFDSALENDPHALWFFGKLKCDYIDELWNQFDDRFESEEEADKSNPIPIIDPSRRSGLTREHPFVAALFRESLKRLRPLVEEERRREEGERATIESKETRKRLNALEKAAAKFMQENRGDDEPARDPDAQETDSQFKKRGFSLSPPFLQLVVGHSSRFWLNINQEAFPEFEVGATVQVDCLSSDIISDKRFIGLEPHPKLEGVLRAIWKIKAINSTSATGIVARVGSIVAESTIEVLDSESDKYKHITAFCFSKQRYRVRTDSKRKKIRLLAPISLVPSPSDVEIEISDEGFLITGKPRMHPDNKKSVAICEFTVKPPEIEAIASMTARVNTHEASAKIQTVPPSGARLKIKLEDIDLTNQRYRWRKNVLEIAARHPSLKRYLGDKSQGFPGQENKHFRLLLAEIVADAVCAKLVSRNVAANPEEYEDADWDHYYAEFSMYMTKFLPLAHKLQCPEG